MRRVLECRVVQRRAAQSRVVSRGFTLVELLVVIAIIGVLVALLLPAVQAAREAARRSQCVSQIKQLGLSVQNHHDTKKQFPTGRSTINQMGVSWAFSLLPYMEASNVYDSFVKTRRVDDVTNAAAMRTPVNIYFCPSRRSPAADRDFDNNDTATTTPGVAAGGDYVANPGHKLLEGLQPGTDDPLPRLSNSTIGPIFTFSKITARRVIDGLSSTFVLAEKHIPPARTDAPGQEHYWQGDTGIFPSDCPNAVFRGSENGLASSASDPSREKLGSEHAGVVQAVFLDGHVDSLSKDTETNVLKLMSSIGDGQVIPATL